jgi:dolichol-phosphate mannosyltransferase
MKKLVVVLFTYNERDTLEKTVKDVFNQQEFIPGYDIEIVISDSHSPDGTGEIAGKLAKQNKKIHYIDVGRGIGVGIIEGHLYSLKYLKPDIMAQLDADGQVDADVLQKLVKVIDEGNDLAIGSRFVKGGKNQLSLFRKMFTWGASWVYRVIVGPVNVQEVTNSARAFTPELFEKINLKRLPWKEDSFIIQPAFLNEALSTGAKFKEVPLVFKNRAEGYSKNKVFNYIYDMFAYAADARLHKWGFNIPLFKASRRAKTLIKFSLVGFTGTMVDFMFYKILINYFGLTPAMSKGFSTEMGIINNFLLNNFWTFRSRKVSTNIYQRFGMYNLISFGGLLIAVIIVKMLHNIYGDGFITVMGRPIAYNNFYFFATIPPVMIWNFTANHFITWRKKKD